MTFKPRLRGLFYALLLLVLIMPLHGLLAQSGSRQFLPFIKGGSGSSIRDPQFRLVNYSMKWAPQDGAAATMTNGNEVLYMSRYTPGAKYILNAVNNGSSFQVMSASSNGLTIAFSGGSNLESIEVPITLATAQDLTAIKQDDGSTLVVVPAADPAQAQAILIPAGAALGTTVLTAGMASVLVPVGVGLIIIGGFAYVGYIVYQADQADIGQPLDTLLPTPGLNAAQAIAAHDRWMAQLDAETPEGFLGPVESANTDASGQPGDPDPCRWFPNHGGSFPKGWNVRVPKRLPDDVVVEIVDEAGQVVSRAEASTISFESKLVGQVGVVTKPAFRQMTFGTAAARIASDVLVDVNRDINGDAITEFILNDEAKFGSQSWKCRTAGAAVRFLNEFARVFEYLPFRGQAGSLGIPPY